MEEANQNEDISKQISDMKVDLKIAKVHTPKAQTKKEGEKQLNHQRKPIIRNIPTANFQQSRRVKSAITVVKQMPRNQIRDVKHSGNNI